MGAEKIFLLDGIVPPLLVLSFGGGKGLLEALGS
jgi:hypothetical protein